MRITIPAHGDSHEILIEVTSSGFVISQKSAAEIRQFISVKGMQEELLMKTLMDIHAID